MNVRSLHFRLTGWYAGWLAVVFTAFGTLIYVAAKHYLETNLRDILNLRAGQVADLAVQIHGGTGYMREVPVERIYREVRLLRLYEGTSEIQRLIIGGGLVKAAQRGQ